MKYKLILVLPVLLGYAMMSEAGFCTEGLVDSINNNNNNKYTKPIPRIPTGSRFVKFYDGGSDSIVTECLPHPCTESVRDSESYKIFLENSHKAMEKYESNKFQ